MRCCAVFQCCIIFCCGDLFVEFSVVSNDNVVLFSLWLVICLILLFDPVLIRSHL